jgi:hypothetical protein
VWERRKLARTLAIFALALALVIVVLFLMWLPPDVSIG